MDAKLSTKTMKIDVIIKTTEKTMSIKTIQITKTIEITDKQKDNGKPMMIDIQLK